MVLHVRVHLLIGGRCREPMKNTCIMSSVAFVTSRPHSSDSLPCNPNPDLYKLINHALVNQIKPHNTLRQQVFVAYLLSTGEALI